jgi:hypothetical protein
VAPGWIIAVVLLLSLTPGCRSTPYRTVSPDDVAIVLLGDTSTHEPQYERGPDGEVIKVPVGIGFAYAQKIPFNEYTTITNHVRTARLLSLLGTPREREQTGASFAGTLGGQFFLDRDGALLLHVTVICDNSTVIVGRDGEVIRTPDGYLYVPPTNLVETLTVRRPDYVREIYTIISAEAPGEIEKRKQHYERLGIDFEEMLFNGPPKK